MDFLAVEGTHPFKGELIYDRRGLSFDFRPGDPKVVERASDALELAYGSMAFQIDRSMGDVLGVWGYHPDALWQARTLPLPVAKQAQLRVDLPEVPARGVALRLVPVGDLSTQKDPDNGWIRVGRKGEPSGTEFVEFVDGAIAELSNAQLVALWLRPRLIG